MGSMSRRGVIAAAGLGAASLPLGAAAQATAAGTDASANARRRGPRVETGATAWKDANWAELRGRRVGVISNPTGILPDLTHIVDRMHADGVNIVAVFGPEHGFRGTAQAGASEGKSVDPRTGITVYDAYGANAAKFKTMFAEAKVDTIVFDIQDVGARFYTYIWTMYNAMQAAAEAGGIRFVVFDRPNPVGGTARGPMMQPGFTSGVGLKEILLQHGMTVGELAQLFNAEYLPKEPTGKTIAQLTVAKVRGWKGELFDDTGLPWVLPSPNMPTTSTALLYPGTGLFEATNMSEGRGTTKPFEIIGAPYVDHRWAAELKKHRLPGVDFREAYFTPTFSKNANLVCGGVEVHITDPDRVNALAVAAHMFVDARKLYPAFDARGDAWRWLGLLTGSNRFRDQLLAGASAEEIIAAWAGEERAWTARRRPYLLYKRKG
ncbi:exo-beta-N-acetylmuramidase NamZ family protein [Nigerium massiliense]|uniref:exo-beta-N-acetylmuramidase NamZ family protein n=1 Tax=Nigerium massiliense TaxID=1522317 RepID=UPI00058C1DFF|nr:DUF1343 domain-containing protein [Nigerium massiliense]